MGHTACLALASPIAQAVFNLGAGNAPKRGAGRTWRPDRSEATHGEGPSRPHQEREGGTAVLVCY
jgi:hypothetical protein